MPYNCLLPQMVYLNLLSNFGFFVYYLYFYIPETFDFNFMTGLSDGCLSHIVVWSVILHLMAYTFS